MSEPSKEPGQPGEEQSKPARNELFTRFGTSPSFSWWETTIEWVFRGLAYLTIAVTIRIIVVLVMDARHFFEHVGFWEYVSGTVWDPGSEKFGVLPLLNGTLMIAAGACAISIPLGLGTAIYLTQYAPSRVRNVVSPMIEILGGIPTVVYGYFAITAVTPFLRIFLEIQSFNALSGSIVVGIAITPMVSSLSAEALRLVPRSIQNAGYALGMRKIHVVTRIMIPAAFSGIISSFILAFARAVGETMAVTLAAGQMPNININYLEQIQTITAYIVYISTSDVEAGSIKYYTIYALGLTLFVITFVFNFIAVRIVRRFREVYQ